MKEQKLFSRTKMQSGYKESSAAARRVRILYAYSTRTMTEKDTHKKLAAHAERFANEPNSLFEKTLHLSKRSQQELASPRLFISFFACIVLLYSSPGIFFSTNKIQSERILEANIRSFIWRLVKEEEDDEECVCVHKYVDAVALR